MLDLALVIVLTVHAAAFGRLYLAKGRRIHNGLLVLGFTMLAFSHGLSALASLTGAPENLAWQGLRWTGLGLCGLAIPALLTGLVRRLQRRFRRMTFDQET